MLENAKINVMSNDMKRFQAPIYQYQVETTEDIEDKQIHNESAYLFVSQSMNQFFFTIININIIINLTCIKNISLQYAILLMHGIPLILYVLSAF